MKLLPAERLKSFLDRTVPGTYRAMRGVWRRSHVRRFERRLHRVERAVVQRHGLRVLEGPFAGMIYPAPRALGSALAPKLLGSYEAELHGTLAGILEAPGRYAAVVNVGCAEGYYAVGLALRLPHARVYAFDADPQARALCGEMARINGVADRVIIGAACDAARLAAQPLEQALLVCDIDGGEVSLLRPDAVPSLKVCDILVELHDCLQPGITAALLPRFASTHEIALIDSVERDPGEYPATEFLRREDRRLALDELRPPQQWAFLTARTRDTGGR